MIKNIIKDIFIIKDGIPLLTEHCAELGGILSNNDNALMISGFFSALDSLSDQFQDFGNISELKLSNDMKLSFMRDPKIDNLIYIASTDTKSDEKSVKKILKKISSSFSNKYNANMLEKWSGKRADFKDFKEELEKIYNHDDNLEESNSNQVIEEKPVIQKNHEENNDENKNEQVIEVKTPPKKNSFSNAKPLLRINSNSNPERFLSGEMAIKIFKEINGNNNIAYIAQKLQYEEVEVFNICKNFTKMGLIAFSM